MKRQRLRRSSALAFAISAATKIAVTSATGATSVALVMAIAITAGPAGLARSEETARTVTETLFDATRDASAVHDSTWDTGRDAGRLAREYSTSELRLDGEPRSLLWRFVSRGPVFNDIFLHRSIAAPLDRVRVRVKNEGPAVTFSAKVLDAGGAEWAGGRTKLEAAGDWRWIEFPASEWKPAPWSGDPDGRLDFPLQYFTAIAFDVAPGTEYKIRIALVEVQRPAPPVLSVRAVDAPATVRAGESFDVPVEFQLDRDWDPEVVELVLVRGRSEYWRRKIEVARPIAGGKAQEVGRVSVGVPRFASGGRTSLVLRMGSPHRGRAAADIRQELASFTVEAANPGKTIARVRPKGGVPTLFIDGKARSGMSYAAYGPGVEVFRDFARAGVDLFTFSATPTEAGYGLSRTAWLAPDDYDYSQLDERALMVLEANPEAYFFPRLYLHAPPWWSERHPEDVVLMDPGDGKPVPFIHEGGKPAPSWASEAWRKDTIEGLKRLIAHIEASPYAGRVIGYHLASGTTEEWMMWGGNEDQWVDYSPANLGGFRAWLRAKYRSDEALRAAWKDASVRLDTAAIPKKAVRLRSELGALRDPAKEAAAIDFYLYNSDLVAETICLFARAVKEATRGEKIVGAFYGYLLQLCGEQRQQNGGHLALARVLESRDIDFLTSPTSYAFRQLGGEGTSHFMSLLGSVQLHGKLWFDENDIRTSIAPGQVGTWGKPDSIAGDFLQQEKELANVIVHGSAQWWFDVGGNRYDDARLLERIAALARSAGEAMSLDRSPADEVAFAVDERSLTRLRVADPLGTFLLLAQLPMLHRLGAPVGHYLISDLPRLEEEEGKPDTVAKRLFILPTSFAPSAEDRRAVDSLKRGGRVLVFLWNSGLYRDGAIDEKGMEEYTGIRLRAAGEPVPLRVKIRGGHPLTDGLDGVEYGVDHAAWPLPFADDPDARVLGVLADGRPGLVVKELNGWTAIHSTAPCLPAALLRRIASWAGVHLYVDSEDVVWATRDLVAVSVARGGTRTIRLPRRTSVRSLYDGAEIGTDLTTFDADFPEFGTRVFVVR